jgi:hypothetical protein
MHFHNSTEAGRSRAHLTRLRRKAHTTVPLNDLPSSWRFATKSPVPSPRASLRRRQQGRRQLCRRPFSKRCTVQFGRQLSFCETPFGEKTRIFKLFVWEQIWELVVSLSIQLLPWAGRLSPVNGMPFWPSAGERGVGTTPHSCGSMARCPPRQRARVTRAPPISSSQFRVAVQHGVEHG